MLYLFINHSRTFSSSTSTSEKKSERKSLFQRVFRSRAAYFLHNSQKKIMAHLRPYRFLFLGAPLVLLALGAAVFPLTHTIVGFVYVSGPFLFKVVIPFAVVLLAISVIIQNNPMHSLLSLISLFLLTVATYLYLGAEYLGLVFLVVYVGAVAILFLFVVMLIPIAPASGAEAKASYFSRIVHNSQRSALLLGAVTVPLLLAFVHRLFSSAFIERAATLLATLEPTSVNAFVYNVMISRNDIFALLGLYTAHGALFMLITLILLIAMIGAIVLASPRADAISSIAQPPRPAVTRSLISRLG